MAIFLEGDSYMVGNGASLAHAIYENDKWEIMSSDFALPTEWVNSKPYLNDPQFVFYTSDGRKIVVSKVQGIPTATSNILEIQ